MTGGNIAGSVYLANNGTLQSSATLSSLEVQAGTTATITGSGSVTGLAASFGTIINHGNIAGLAIGSGTATNYGTISGNSGVHGGCLTLAGGSVNSGDFLVTNGFLHANATITGNVTSSTLGGTVEVLSGGNVVGSTTISDTGSLLLSGTINNLSISGGGGNANVVQNAVVRGQTVVSSNGSLTTNGTLSGGLVTTGGTVNTYADGTVINTNNLTLGAGTTLDASGSNVANYGRITAPEVILNSPALSLGNVVFGSTETAYTLINNTGPNPVIGTFDGLAEGSPITVGPDTLLISYLGGAGNNDVVLYLQSHLTTDVNTASDVTGPNDGLVTLREAINHARLQSIATGTNQDVTFNASALFSGSNSRTIILSNAADYGVLAVNQNATLSIIGPNVSTANSLTISGVDLTGLFDLQSDTNLSNLTLARGNASQGGAINNNATTTLTGLTIQDNSATDGGGISNGRNGILTIINTTLARNTALASGGAISNDGGCLTMRNTTIADNTAANGGGVLNDGGLVTLVNTIIADNTAGTGPDLEGSATASFSLVGNTTGASLSGIRNQLDVDALLGMLGTYESPAQVFPLLPGSPAIDSGEGVGLTDQRGITVAGDADMGSFQSRGFSLTRGTGDNQTTMIGEDFPTNLSLSVSSSYGEPVQGGVISLSFTNGSGSASANGTGLTSPISAQITGGGNLSSGGVSIQAVANANYSAENYVAEANTSGAVAAVGYTLRNVGTPSVITITAGNNQSGPLTGAFGQSLAVNVQDSVGNNIPRLSVSFTPQTNAYGATGTINGLGTYNGTTDASGNIAGLIYAQNGIGGQVTVSANATVGTNAIRLAGGSVNSNFTEGAVGLNVQNGLIGRSFVNAVDGLFGNSTLAADLLSNSRIRIQYLGLDGTSAQAAVGNSANETIGLSGSNATFSYGSLGIAGDNNSEFNDGIYAFQVDYDGDGTFETGVKFHRLFGDVNGDSLVDTVDYNAVNNRGVFGRYGIFSEDTNGAGRVFTKDITNTLRQRGRYITPYNPYG